jgi:hypothetical protein
VNSDLKPRISCHLHPPFPSPEIILVWFSLKEMKKIEKEKERRKENKEKKSTLLSFPQPPRLTISYEERPSANLLFFFLLFSSFSLSTRSLPTIRRVGTKGS